MKFLLGSVLLAVACAGPFGPVPISIPPVQSQADVETIQQQLSRAGVPPRAIGEFFALRMTPAGETPEQFELRKERMIEWHKRWTPQFMLTTTPEPTTTEDPLKDMKKHIRENFGEVGLPSDAIEDYIDMVSDYPSEVETAAEIQQRAERMRNSGRRFENLMEGVGRRDQAKRDAVKEVATEVAAIFEKSRAVTSVMRDILLAEGELTPGTAKSLQEFASTMLGEYERVLVEKVLTHTIKKISQKTGVPRPELQILLLGEL